jgi:hypothetical protein
MEEEDGEEMKRRSEREDERSERLTAVDRRGEGGRRRRGAEEHYTETGHVAHALVLRSSNGDLVR